MPKDLKERAAYLRSQISSNQKELQGDITRYSEFREHGPAVLSTYDVGIAYGGDVVGALRGSLMLKAAHISCHLSLLVKLALELEEVETEIVKAAPPQLALF